MNRILTFPDVDALSEALCNDFEDYILELGMSQARINLALSGGNTPRAFFQKLAGSHAQDNKKSYWEKIHIFWVDERCVSPDHPDSNYGMTRKYLLRPVGFEENNIHRIRGENDPQLECIRYMDEIKGNIPFRNGFPVFDWTFLGAGEDGHTASIFPDRPDLIHHDDVCAVVKHPFTGQYRITLTGNVLANARRLTFLVTGASKCNIITKILNKDQTAEKYPAAAIIPVSGTIEWYLDKAAACGIKKTGHG
jgi:6-phosphogluconolactonase